MLHLAFLFLASSAVAVAVASPAPVPPLTSTPSYARNNARWARWESTPSDNDDDMEFYWAWPFMVFLIVVVVMIIYASIHQERRVSTFQGLALIPGSVVAHHAH